MNEMVQPELFSTRDKVIAFEDLMRKQPQVELKHKDHFSFGVYARELFIPKGVILTGKIHKFENLNVMTKGRMAVLIGDDVLEVEAPFVIVSPPGTKRIAMALEDTIWLTVHGTHEKDLDKIEEFFIAQNDKEFIEFKQMLLLDG